VSGIHWRLPFTKALIVSTNVVSTNTDHCFSRRSRCETAANGLVQAALMTNGHDNGNPATGCGADSRGDQASSVNAGPGANTRPAENLDSRSAVRREGHSPSRRLCRYSDRNLRSRRQRQSPKTAAGPAIAAPPHACTASDTAVPRMNNGVIVRTSSGVLPAARSPPRDHDPVARRF
jgi:hypothetical protein